MDPVSVKSNSSCVKETVLSSALELSRYVRDMLNELSFFRWMLPSRVSIQSKTDNSRRMNLYDMVTQLTFSDLIGFVKHGQDVDGFIAGIYSMSWFAGLIATLPWLMNPLIHNNLTKRFFLPRSGDKSGTGQVMKVFGF